MWRLFRRKFVHEHRPKLWDGYFEHCRCGTSAGDVRDANGMRHLFFRDWPEELRTVWMR